MRNLYRHPSYLFGDKPQLNAKKQFKAEIIKSLLYIILSSLVFTMFIYMFYFFNVAITKNHQNILAYLSSDTPIGLFFNYMLMILSYYIVYYITFKRTNNIIKEFPQKEETSVSQNKVLMCLIGFGFAMFGDIVSYFVCEATKVISKFFNPEIQQQVIESTTGGELQYSNFETSILGFITYFVFIVIVPPIVEELIFRKVIYDHLNIFSPKVAILLSCGLFAVFHGNIQQTSFALFAGFGFVLVRKYTDSIYYCIITHTFVNLLAFVSQYFSTNSVVLTISNSFVIISAVFAILMFAFNTELVNTLFKHTTVKECD